jgi:hypothetical protein
MTAAIASTSTRACDDDDDGRQRSMTLTQDVIPRCLFLTSDSTMMMTLKILDFFKKSLYLERSGSTF